MVFGVIVEHEMDVKNNIRCYVETNNKKSISYLRVALASPPRGLIPVSQPNICRIMFRSEDDWAEPQSRDLLIAMSRLRPLHSPSCETRRWRHEGVAGELTNIVNIGYAPAYIIY